MSFEENLESIHESQLAPEALSLLQRMGKDPKELTPEQIDRLNSKFESIEGKEKEKGLTKKEDQKTIGGKEQNTSSTETSKEKLKNLEGKELTPERAGEFREVIKKTGIEVEMTSEEAKPVVEITNNEFNKELNSIEAYSALLGEDDPEQETNRMKINGEMILLTLNQVHKSKPILENTFGSTGHDGTAGINLYRILTTLYSHDTIFEADGRMSNEGVRVIEKISVTFLELEKKFGSVHHALNDDSKDNPFYCISQQEFTPHRLESEQARKVWSGENNA